MKQLDCEPEDGRTEIDLTPMLDVVFIMLIFFIVSAVFIREPGVEIARPKAESSTMPLVATLVAISSDNEFWVAGKTVDLASLAPQIERALAASPGGDLVIQADAEALSGATLAVMDAARAAGIESVVIATER